MSFAWSLVRWNHPADWEGTVTTPLNEDASLAAELIWAERCSADFARGPVHHIGGEEKGRSISMDEGSTRVTADAEGSSQWTSRTDGDRSEGMLDFLGSYSGEVRKPPARQRHQSEGHREKHDSSAVLRERTHSHRPPRSKNPQGRKHRDKHATRDRSIPSHKSRARVVR